MHPTCDGGTSNPIGQGKNGGVRYRPGCAGVPIAVHRNMASLGSSGQTKFTNPRPRQFLGTNLAIFFLVFDSVKIGKIWENENSPMDL